MLEIRPITTGKKKYLPLLLDADPSEEMVDRYLESGAMYVLFADGVAVSEAVVTEAAFAQCELKNLATAPALQRQGYAACLLKYLFEVYAEKCSLMWVGTADAGIPFYRRFGFVYSHALMNFFPRHYPQPIYDSGRQCVDMLYLRKDLRPEGQRLV